MPDRTGAGGKAAEVQRLQRKMCLDAQKMAQPLIQRKTGMIFFSCENFTLDKLTKPAGSIVADLRREGGIQLFFAHKVQLRSNRDQFCRRLTNNTQPVVLLTLHGQNRAVPILFQNAAVRKNTYQRITRFVEIDPAVSTADPESLPSKRVITASIEGMLVHMNRLMYDHQFGMDAGFQQS